MVNLIEMVKVYQEEDLSILIKKNNDYSKGEDFKNFTLVEKLGITNVENGILVRICDKVARLSNIINADTAVTDEKVSDTLSDLSNYCMILRAYIETKNKNVDNPSA